MGSKRVLGFQTSLGLWPSPAAQAPSMVERGDWGSGDDKRMLQALVTSGATQARSARCLPRAPSCWHPVLLSRMPSASLGLRVGP